MPESPTPDPTAGAEFFLERYRDIYDSLGCAPFAVLFERDSGNLGPAALAVLFERFGALYSSVGPAALAVLTYAHGGRVTRLEGPPFIRGVKWDRRPTRQELESIADSMVFEVWRDFYLPPDWTPLGGLGVSADAALDEVRTLWPVVSAVATYLVFGTGGRGSITELLFVVTVAQVEARFLPNEGRRSTPTETKAD